MTSTRIIIFSLLVALALLALGLFLTYKRTPKRLGQVTPTARRFRQMMNRYAKRTYSKTSFTEQETSALYNWLLQSQASAGQGQGVEHGK